MIALARRYRPKRFADLLVQDHVAAVLRGAVARGRVGHGYLLTGPRGVGKTTAARILAMALNCPNRDPSGEPCGICDECMRVWTGSANLDVVEIDAASNRGVDDARDLRERAMYAASREGRYKVYIVDEAHMLTREAWNALLKILEEPPPRVVFVFATTEPQKIGATAAPVLSRLQRFDFRRIGPAAIRARLQEVLAQEAITAEEDAVTLIARHADGGMRDALSMLDQCMSFGEGAITATRVREVLGLAGDELYAEVLALVAERRPAGVFPLVDRLMDAGSDLAEFMGGAAEMLRALLMQQLGSEPEGITEAMRDSLRRYQKLLAPGDVLRMLKLLADNETAIRRSANARLVVETLLLRWAMLDRIVDLQQVIEGAPAGGQADRRAGGQADSESPALVSASRALTAELPPARPPARLPASTIEFSLDGLRGAWPEIVAAVRERRAFLGEATATAEPAEAAPPWLTIRLPESSALFVQPLQEQAAVVEEILSQVLGQPVRLRVVAGTAAGPVAPAPPKRISDASIRADRLKSLRARDPALDLAADALDLEIVE
ncbi:MAG TPA: DNA polymerase III subunit gamma/tau [Gemmatimonadales bacterium]|nr:DNA polymerase III subunit gamma/tau [Gemmatimonadales bacterium]